MITVIPHVEPPNPSLKQTVGPTVFLTERRVYFNLSSRPLLSFSYAGFGIWSPEKQGKGD